MIHSRPEIVHTRPKMIHTHQTAPTQFVEANGICFAYRCFGKSGSVPLIFNQHFTGTMDHWDPAVRSISVSGPKELVGCDAQLLLERFRRLRAPAAAMPSPGRP